MSSSATRGASAAAPSKNKQADLSSSTTSERSLAFKRWARGKCYRCLASDHQVRSCPGPFRCIRCRRPGHREQYCRFRSPSPPSRVSSHEQHHLHRPQSWVDVVSKSRQSANNTESVSREEHSPSSPAFGSNSMGKKITNNSDHKCCCAPLTPSTADLQSMRESMVELLRSEISQVIAVHFEEMVRPLREEVSTLRLWIARMTSNLEHVETHGKQAPMPDVVEFFRPCSPIWRSPSQLPFASSSATSVSSDLHVEKIDSTELAANTSTAKVDKEVTCVADTLREKPIETNTKVTHAEDVNETTLVGVSDAHMKLKMSHEAHLVDPDIVTASRSLREHVVEETSEVLSKSPAAQIHLVSPKKRISMQPISQATDFARTQDATREVDPLLDDSFSSDVTTGRKDENSTNPTPPIKAARRRRQPYVKSLLHRNTRPARRNILKELGFIQKDGNLDGSKLDVFADVMKEILPQDLLISLMKLEGHAFWETMATILDTLF